jgi:hypothetical protein
MTASATAGTGSPPAARSATVLAVLVRIAAAAGLATSGYLHAELYLHGYRAIPGVAPAFLLQASGSFAVALLLLVAGPVILRLGAVALALGALAGFVASRTVGVFGFVERGFDPAPQALISVLVEVAVLLLLAPPLLLAATRYRARRSAASAAGGTPPGRWSR